MRAIYSYGVLKNIGSRFRVATDVTVACVLLRRSTNHISTNHTLCVTVDALFYLVCLFPSFSHFQVVLVSIAMARITAMTSTRQNRQYDDSWGSYRLYRCLSRRLSRQNVATVVVVTDSHTQSSVLQQSSVVMNCHNRSSWPFVTTVCHGSSSWLIATVDCHMVVLSWQRDNSLSQQQIVTPVCHDTLTQPFIKTVSLSFIATS